jgi:hypothetical protein
MYACDVLVHLLHAESIQIETTHQLSWHWVHPHVGWVNAQWDSTSNEKKQKAVFFMRISYFRVDIVDMELHIESVDMESHSAIAQLTGMRPRTNRVIANRKKKIRVFWRIQEQNQKYSKALSYGIFGTYVKSQNKKSLASVPLLQLTPSVHCKKARTEIVYFIWTMLAQNRKGMGPKHSDTRPPRSVRRHRCPSWNLIYLFTVCGIFPTVCRLSMLYILFS